MKIVSSQQMKKIDQRAIEEYGISGLVLMENAGLKVFNNMKNIYPDLIEKEVAIIAGSGNNGGDGFVVARHLYNYGVKVKVFLLCSFNKVKGDAKTNLNIIDKMGIELLEIVPSKIQEIEEIISVSDIIIDAILGTGLQGMVAGLKAKIIDVINRSRKEIVSIDIPSGLNADTGRIEGICVKANYTITMALSKIGLLIYPGVNYVGKLIVEDISIPQSLLKDKELKFNLITREIVRLLLPARLPDNHKGSFGKVLLLAGSMGMTGAAYLASEAAIKSGTGIVVLGIPKSLNDIMEVKLTEVMTLPLEETKEKTLDEKAEDKILKLLKDFSIMGIGPGISRQLKTQSLINRLVKNSSIPLILDADALYSLGENPEILKKAKVPIIITPHPGEMARLINKEVGFVLDNRIQVVKEVAQEFGIVVVLKGARTIIADNNGNTFLNIGDNSGMATGGSGDILTGIISSLIAQGLNDISAAVAGVYIHSFAGSLARDIKGERGMTAGDILMQIPQAFLQIENVV